MKNSLGVLLLIAIGLAQSGCTTTIGQSGSSEEVEASEEAGAFEPSVLEEPAVEAMRLPPQTTDDVCLKKHTTLQSFPWPPPKPSAVLKLPRASLLDQYDRPKPLTLDDISRELQSVLLYAGHYHPGYLAIGCDGFALITNLERVDDAGRSLDDSERWVDSLDRAAENSKKWTGIRDYILRLFYEKPGYYRKIIFAATDEPYVQDGHVEATREQFDVWKRDGRGSLPRGNEVTFGDDHELYVLIYEFKKNDTDGKVSQNTPSRIGSHGHLEFFYSALEERD